MRSCWWQMTLDDLAALPVPVATELSRPFWDACGEGRYLIQTCAACGHRHSTPQDFCLSCHQTNLTWEPASGYGAIYSFTIVWRPQTAAFDVPYVVAIVELDEGPFLITNVVDCEPGAVAVGMRVEITFCQRGDVSL